MRFSVIVVVAMIFAGCSSQKPTQAPEREGPSKEQKPVKEIPQAPVVKPAQPVRIVWAGDITMGSRYGLPPREGTTMFTAVKSQLAGDVVWGNLEGTLSEGGVSKCGSTASSNCFAFQAPPSHARALKAAGFDGMNLANNHASDYGSSGLDQTRSALRRQRIASTGAPGQITFVEHDGTRIAFVGFASYGWSAQITDLEGAAELVRQADRSADIVVALFHGGAEGSDQTHTPRGAEYAYGEHRGDLRAFAHTVIDAGADLVAGSGPHVIRGLELYRGRAIAYSLGNFAGYHNFSTGGTLSLSGVLAVDIRPDGTLAGGQWRSVILDSTPFPHPDPERRSLRLVRQLSNEDFGRSSVRMNRYGVFLPASRQVD